MGGKCASLARMIAMGVPVPRGFAVATDAYAAHLAASGLDAAIREELSHLDTHNVTDEETRSQAIRRLVTDRAMPVEVSAAQALIDCHSGGIELCFLSVAGFYGEGAGIGAAASAASRALAQARGLPDLWRLPATPGVLSREAAAAGLAVIGCEIGGRGAARPGDVAL